MVSIHGFTNVLVLDILGFSSLRSLRVGVGVCIYLHIPECYLFIYHISVLPYDT